MASRHLSPDYKDLVKVIAKSSTTTSTKSCASINVQLTIDNKESGIKSLSSDYRPNGKEGFGAITNSSTTSSTKSRAPDHTPASTDDNRKISEMKHPFSVSVKSIPSKVGLPELIEAISVFGKVSAASFVTTSDKFKCCNIEFEVNIASFVPRAQSFVCFTSIYYCKLKYLIGCSLKDAGSSRRAVMVGKVEVGSLVFIVNPIDAVDLVTVRIDNINVRTTDSAVHSICKSAGELVGLTRTSGNRVDAFFNVQNRTCHLDIVKK